MQQGYPNAWGAKIPVTSGWNVALFDALLADYEDREVIQWLKYGWPISRLPTWPDPTPMYKNHKGVTDYPDARDKYIDKEKRHGTICGPFPCPPFDHRLGISPLSSRAKCDSSDQRIISDLSFPENSSINSGIIKDQFMGFNAKLSFPRVDAMAIRIAELGLGTYMFKIDFSRSFRQLPIDPGDYSLLCFFMERKHLF